MITFGYKNKFNGPIRALTAIAIGLVMVMSRANALELVVKIIAVFLLASGLVSLFVGYKHRANGAMGLMGFNAAVDLILGVALFLFPGFVAGLLIYFIAFLLIGFGLFQLIGLISANRVVKVGVAAFLFPVIVLGLGAFLMASPSFVGEAIGVVAGAALIVYGASELFSSWKMRKAIDEYEIRQAPADTSDAPASDPMADVKDVEFEKVDEQ